MLTVKAPGKQFVAGEYAVVSGMPSILVALDRFITVKIGTARKYGTIISKQYQEKVIYWRREGNQMILDSRDDPFDYILAAIKITEKYVLSLGKKLRIYRLRIDSQLDSPDGKKYGLGSSAAVTVATVNALCRFYKVSITKKQLFKLSAIAHLSVQKNGSLGDTASIVYGGWIAYQTFDHEWLKIMQRSISMRELINRPWPHLKIESLTPPPNLRLLIGWTGQPASTSHLVDKVSLGKIRRQKMYQTFLVKSRNCVKKMIAGFRQRNLKRIQAEIEINRKLLNRMAYLTGVKFETPRLQKLCQIAAHFGGVAKSSGAGGGDCGIAIINQDLPIAGLLKSWRANHIQPLNFRVYQNSQEH